MVVAMVMISLSEMILMELLKKLMKDRLLEAIKCITVAQRERDMCRIAINFQKSLIEVR